MAGRRDKRRRQEARRQAHLDRVAGDASEAAQQARRDRRRDESARTAAAGPSAARWLIAAPDAVDGSRSVPLDVVADLLALDPRTRLRGRGDADLRRLAGQVESLVGMGVAAPSGRLLLDVLVTDVQTRTALEPTLDLEALLSDAPVTDRAHDRTVRLAEAMLVRAAEHREGVVDLHSQVAPVGVDRHPGADELETIVHVATEHVQVPANAVPAVVVTTGGWVGASPLELFLTAARGMLDGTAAEVGGAALYAWLEQVVRAPDDPWWLALSAILDVDAPALLQPSAARAGSDHPDVVGSVLVELIALRHPLL